VILGKKLGLVVNLSMSYNDLKDEHVQYLAKMIIERVKKKKEN